MTIEVTDSSFEQEVLKSSIPVLVDFWAPWCGPCKQIAPIIDEISQSLSDKIKVMKCNVDENPETPSKMMVRGIPTLVIFKDGKIVDTKVGSIPKATLLEWIQSSI